MKITKAEIKQILLEEVGGYIFDKEGKITPANLQQALDALFQRLKDEDKAEDSKNEATDEELTEGIGKDYLDKVAREYFMEKDFDSAEVKPNANDVAAYIGETETDEVDELELADWLYENDYSLKEIAEYQFEEEKYNFDKMRGAGEYDSSIIIYKVVDRTGIQIPIPGEKGKNYPFLSGTDRGSLDGNYPLLEEKHVKLLKSISDIFEPVGPKPRYEYFKTKNEATEDELKNKREEIELLQREKELKQDIKNLQTEVYTEADAWNNAYIEGLNQGMSEDEAADYADKKAEEYLTMNELKKVQRKIKEGSISVEEVREVVRKVGGKYALYTKKKDPKTGERRRLGTHDTKSQAEEQERAIYANKK